MAQFLTQARQQRVMGDLPQVSDVHPVRQSLSPGCTHSDEACGRIQGPCRHGQFGAALVAGVDHRIKRFASNLGPVVGLYKTIHHSDFTTGLVAGNSLFHGQHFGLADVGIGGVNLPVDVGLGNMVHVNQSQAPHPAACQGLCGPRAHAAYAHHHHMGAGNALGGICTIQSLQ